jgi:chorismate mutase/prephenate dehydratase
MSGTTDGTMPDEDLVRLRARIDELDRTIVGLLNERAALALDAGRLKAAAGRDGVRDAAREREVLLRVALANEGPLPQAGLLELYRAFIETLVALEERDVGRGEV